MLGRGYFPDKLGYLEGVRGARSKTRDCFSLREKMKL